MVKDNLTSGRAGPANFGSRGRHTGILPLVFLASGGFASLSGCATTPASNTQTDTQPVLAEIVSPTKVYALLPMLGGWSRDLDGKSSFPDADMVLVHKETGLKVLLFLNRGTADSLDGVVSGRRKLLRENYHVIFSDEQRRFQGGSQFIPISVSNYFVREPGTGSQARIVSGAVRGHEAVIEILAIGGLYPQSQILVDDLISGLRIFGPEEP